MIVIDLEAANRMMVLGIGLIFGSLLVVAWWSSRRRRK